MSKIILSFIFLVFAFSGKSQIPSNDPSSWILQPDGTSGGTEEFNSSLNTSKWTLYNNFASYWGAEFLKNTNLDTSDSASLKIIADTLSPGVLISPSKWAVPQSSGVTYVYQSGAIESKPLAGNHVYKFGYLEIEAKFPTSVYPLWPAFWLWSQDCSIPYINEIDIVENGNPQTFIGTIMGTNIHLFDGVNCSAYSTSDNGQDITGLPLLSFAWHKYAIQWAPDRVIWYFDDTQVRSIYDASGVNIPQHGMDVVLNMAIDPWWAFLPSDWNSSSVTPHGNSSPTSWPQYFEINYLRYYKLVVDCSSNLTICNPNDYDRKIKKAIITNNTCTPNFNPNNASGSYTLRATDYVTLDLGTEVNPVGTGYFAIETMPCPQ